MEINKDIIEWKMIRPDGSERILHIGKNEVNSRELDILSNNSLILFEIYFSPLLKAYLRFYGYTPLRLNLEKNGEDSKHIYIDNNQSFVFLEQLENTTIDVYDKEEFATFSFQKIIKKPENNKDIIEKNKRMKWLNENIEYEDLKKEENEYGSKSLYSKSFFNYSRKNLKKDEERNDKSDDLMSNFSKSKNEDDDNKSNKEKIDDFQNKEKEKEKEISFKSEESNAEENSEVLISKKLNEKNEESNINNNKIKSKINKYENDSDKTKTIKSMEVSEKDNKTSSKKLSISGKIEKEKEKKIEEKNLKIERKSKSTNSEQSPFLNSQKDFEEEKNEIKDQENKNIENKLLNYDKILDDFVLFNSESESKEDSSNNEEEEEE